MSKIHVVQDGLVNAPPVDVYRFIADYKHHHPNFLPAAFSDVKVERGGIGAGTELSFKVKVGGQSRSMRVRIDEPEPGRVLTESDLDSDTVTSFTVEPAGSVSRVTIETISYSKGIRGLAERAIVPRVLRQMFADELARLDQYARSRLAVA